MNTLADEYELVLVDNKQLRERVLETLDERIASRTRELATFFDLTTSCYDRQELAYEEFYIASIPLAGIPTEKTLY